MSHPCIKLIGQRASGKTYRLFELANRDGSYIVTTIKQKEALQKHAEMLGFINVKVISVKDIILMEYSMIKKEYKAELETDEEIREFYEKNKVYVYIDDLDEVIDDFLPGFIQVRGASLTAGYELMMPTYQNKDFKK